MAFLATENEPKVGALAVTPWGLHLLREAHLPGWLCKMLCDLMSSFGWAWVQVTQCGCAASLLGSHQPADPAS